VSARRAAAVAQDLEATNWSPPANEAQARELASPGPPLPPGARLGQGAAINVESKPTRGTW
jgi:hypothetical protein